MNDNTWTDMAETRKVTDDIQKVREAYEAAICDATGQKAGYVLGLSVEMDRSIAALAKRLQPRPAPEKKVWRVSAKTLENFNALKLQRGHAAFILGLHPPNPLDDVAPDIIRERPDLVAAEWERRYRASGGSSIGVIAGTRRYLFPELDP